jgi:hypothetical protein
MKCCDYVLLSKHKFKPLPRTNALAYCKKVKIGEKEVLKDWSKIKFLTIVERNFEQNFVQKTFSFLKSSGD